MQPGTKVRLLVDVISGKQLIYGKRFEQVTVIADHNGVLIVKGEKGTFTVRADETDEALTTIS